MLDICFCGSMRDLLFFKCKIHMQIRANILDRGLVRMRINYKQGSLSTAIFIDSTSEILSQTVWQIVTGTEGNAAKPVLNMQLIRKILSAFGHSF